MKFGGGNVMMWDCIFWEGIEYATRIEGKMDTQLYCSIPEDELQQSLEFYNQTPDDSRTITPSIPANLPKDGSMTMAIL